MGIEILVTILAGFIMKPKGAAKYAKYLIKARDYLNMLFPEETYPQLDYSKTSIGKADKSDIAVPLEEVEKAAKREGFNLPFIKGM